MAWLPAIVIWATIVGVGAYYIREWLRVGRDPKAATIIPLFSPPEGLSPMALFFVYRRAGAEDARINAGALGSLAELLRRGMATVQKEANGNPWIVRGEGNTEGLQPDLQRFYDKLLPRGRDAAGYEEFAKAAWDYWVDVHGMMNKRAFTFNLGITLRGAAILIVMALITVLLVNFTLPAGNDGAIIAAGGVASLLVFAALSLRRSRIRSHRLLALGLGAAGVFIFLVVIVMVIAAIDEPAGIARAATLAGLFFVFPLIAWAWGVMIALTPEGRTLTDQIKGFRMFIAVADAGRHAIDNAPDPTQDRLDALMPYAIALHVEASWVNALNDSLPLKPFKEAEAKKVA
jgi:hypothetical protein